MNNSFKISTATTTTGLVKIQSSNKSSKSASRICIKIKTPKATLSELCLGSVSNERDAIVCFYFNWFGKVLLLPQTLLRCASFPCAAPSRVATLLTRPLSPFLAIGIVSQQNCPFATQLPKAVCASFGLGEHQNVTASQDFVTDWINKQQRADGWVPTRGL